MWENHYPEEIEWFITSRIEKFLTKNDASDMLLAQYHTNFFSAYKEPLCFVVGDFFNLKCPQQHIKGIMTVS